MLTGTSPLTRPTQRRICFVLEALGAGGAERVISLLASRWAEAGWDVAICSFDAPGDRIYHALDKRVRLLRLGNPDRPTTGRGRELIQRIMRLRRTLLAERPEAVLSFLTKINVLVLTAAIGTRLKVVACERNNPARQQAHPLWNLASALLLRRADAIVAQTKRALDHVPVAVRSRGRIIPNPIEIPPGVPSDYDETENLRVVAVGRLTNQKGFDLLIEAFCRIAARHPAWMLDIWGEGQERRALQRMIAQSPFPDRINLRGLSGIHGGWTTDAAAFVLSSRYEGFPNALGEAMASGLPVIAFDCPYGPRELIRSGHDGILIENENVPALARALDRLMSTPRLRRMLGENAAHSVKRFAPDRIARQWETLVSILAAGEKDRVRIPEAAGEKTAALLRP